MYKVVTRSCNGSTGSNEHQSFEGEKKTNKTNEKYAAMEAVKMIYILRMMTHLREITVKWFPEVWLLLQ